ncbi:MAG: alpha/beta hydrolase [Magnetospirillum sp.]|nr:alpha/beta hydrolase [Magnetospirillum sp.]
MVSYALLARTSTLPQRHHVSISGTGPETVILANGFGTNQTAWSRLLPWLEKRYRVVRFDWCLDPVDHDGSRYTSMTGFADDLLALVIATRSAPCIYIGHSLGGMVGMLAAKQEPDFFSQMIMLAPSPCYINDSGYVGGFEQADIDGLLEQISSNYVQWAQRFSPLAMAGPPDQPEVAEFTRSLLSMRPDEAFAMALTVFRMDLRNLLGGFSTPTTILQTRNDIAVPLAVAEYLHARWPSSTLEILETAGHFPHMTAPDQLIAILERVLRA